MLLLSTAKELLPTAPTPHVCPLARAWDRLATFGGNWGPARWKSWASGLLVSALASTLLVAIVLGVLLRNLLPVPRSLQPGFDFAAKILLRAGVILLGYQLLMTNALSWGAGTILAVVFIVGLGVAGTMLVGRWLGVSHT